MYQSGHRHGENQAAVEHASGASEGDQLGRVADEGAEVGDDQQQLRADERADDDVDPEVQHARLVEALAWRAHHGQLQAQQIRRGQQHAVGVDRGAGPRSNRIGCMRACSDHIEDHQRHTDRYRRVGHVERPEMEASPSRRPRNPRPNRRTIRSMRLPAAPPMMRAMPEARQQLLVRQRARVDRHTDECADGDHRDDDGLAGEVDRVQETERRAGVADVRDVQEVRNHLDAAVRAAPSCGPATS